MKKHRLFVLFPKSRGASIVILSIVCLIVMLITATTLYQVLPVEMHASQRGYIDMRAHYVARSGVEETMSWLDAAMKEYQQAQDETKLPDYKSGSSLPNIDTFVAAADARRPYEESDWRYTLEVVPLQDQTGSFNNSDPKLFTVRSTAFHRDEPVRTIDVLLKQKTFAMYALLSSDSNTPLGVKLTGTPSIFGPVHTNGYYKFDTSGLDWTTAQAYYGDVVTHTKTFTSAPTNGDGNEWSTGNAPYDDAAHASDRYARVFSGGRNNLRQKNPVQLPTNTANLLTQAYSDTLPTTNGVYVAKDSSNKVNGGIYVKGDVARLEMGLDEKGNQKMTFTQPDISADSEVTGYYHTHKSPGCQSVTTTTPGQVTDYSNCIEYYPIPDGDAGGVAGATVVPVCKTYGTKPGNVSHTTWPVCDGALNTPNTKSIYEPTETIVYEVTEAPITIGAKTIGVGKTAVVSTHYSDADQTWVTDSVQELNGQINGNIYIDGNIGKKDSRSGDSRVAGNFNKNANKRYYSGLTGIVKGSAVLDSSGTQVEDSSGNPVFANKTISTPLTKSISLGGDLLQFSPKKFKSYGAPTGSSALDQYSGNRANWANVALDPEDPVEKERYSPNNQHVLGLISEDIWLTGPNNQTNSKYNNGNKKNEVYAVCLAGRTLTDKDGNTVLGADGQPRVSGGFGTYYSLRNNTDDRLGEYALFGGVVQGTSGANPTYKSSSNTWVDASGSAANYNHAWIDGSGGYGNNVKLNYDIEATRQPIFPNLSEFRILRYFERSARES